MLAGIFVSDILEAVPIDRYFELFKPNAGGEGGLIRIRLNFISNLGELPAKPAAPPAAPGWCWGAARGAHWDGSLGGGVPHDLGHALVVGQPPIQRLTAQHAPRGAVAPPSSCFFSDPCTMTLQMYYAHGRLFSKAAVGRFSGLC